MKLEITGKDQNHILKIPFMPAAIRQKFTLALVSGHHLTIDLLESEAEEVLRLTMAYCRSVRNPKNRRSVEKLVDKISGALGRETSPFQAGKPVNSVLEDNVETTIDQLANTVPGWDELPAKQKIQALLNEMTFSGPKEVQSAANVLMRRENTAPQKDFGGLNPEQVSALIYQGWETDTLGIQLNPDLSTEDVAGTLMMREARLFLEALLPDGIKATTAGNLNRKFVTQMLDLLDYDQDYLDYLFQYFKVINEADVMPLFDLRVLLELAELIEIKSTKFVVTNKGRSLLVPGREGDLFHLLFHTKFRVFNLGYHDRILELPQFQDTLGYTMYHLAQAPGGWQSLTKNPARFLLPALVDLMPPPYRDLMVSGILKMRLFEPLELFGLVQLEHDQSDPSPEFFGRITRFRKTPLCEKFIGFDLG